MNFDCGRLSVFYKGYDTITKRILVKDSIHNYLWLMSPVRVDLIEEQLKL